MTTETKEALTSFSLAVSESIARLSNGKDPEWYDVIQKQEHLAKALQQEPEE